MRKILFMAAMLVWFTSLHAQKVVDTYTLSYFNKTYDIEAFETSKDTINIYLGVSAEQATTKALINVSSYNLAEFKNSLQQMKLKFIEWSDVAKKNNVKELSKEMEISFPSVDIGWFGTEWHFAFYQKIRPRFKILDNGTYIVTLSDKYTSSSNEYINETIYWVFSNPKEIDDLISKLDLDKIKAKLDVDVKASELFK